MTKKNVLNSKVQKKARERTMVLQYSLLDNNPIRNYATQEAIKQQNFLSNNSSMTMLSSFPYYPS